MIHSLESDLFRESVYSVQNGLNDLFINCFNKILSAKNDMHFLVCFSHKTEFRLEIQCMSHMIQYGALRGPDDGKNIKWEGKIMFECFCVHPRNFAFAHRSTEIQFSSHYILFPSPVLCSFAIVLQENAKFLGKHKRFAKHFSSHLIFSPSPCPFRCQMSLIQSPLIVIA